jgi:hypothetical protein
VNLDVHTTHRRLRRRRSRRRGARGVRGPPAELPFLRRGGRGLRETASRLAVTTPSPAPRAQGVRSRAHRRGAQLPPRVQAVEPAARRSAGPQRWLVAWRRRSRWSPPALSLPPRSTTAARRVRQRPRPPQSAESWPHRTR